ncbi:MAG: hypothetical protein HYY84_11925 [Deltaproteobacteria bacterium]|nr:hypothetical protein [Deltaproteobacteria bacterium]
MTNPDSASTETTPTDKSLPVRTLVATVLAGLAGLAISHAIVAILGNVAVPSFSKYLLPVALDRELVAVTEWFGAPGGATRWIWISWFAVGATGLAFPFLFNRLWFSRRILSIPGITRIFATIVILGFIEYLTANAPGTLPVNAQAGYESWKPGEFAVREFALRVVFGAVGTAIFFVIVGETALGGNPDRWWNPAATKRSVAGAAALGAAVGAIIASIGELASDSLPALLNAGFFLFSEASEMTRRGWQAISAMLSLTLALTTAAVAALLVALSPSPTGLRRRALAIAIAALPTSASVGVVLGYQHHISEVGEGRFKSLTEVARLEPKPANRVLLLAGAKEPVAFVYEMEAKVSGTMDDEKIGATKTNIDRVQRYLAERAGRWTFHTAKAWDAAGAILDRLLEPDAAIRAKMAAAEKTSSLVTVQLLAIRIPRMPVTAAVREVSGFLLDESRFLARSAGQKSRLAAIARNVGSAARAAELERAAQGMGDKRATDLSANEARTDANGSVSGVVTIRGRAAPNLRVALYRFPTDGRVQQPPLASINLLAATDTNANGSFRFEGLRGAKVMVGVLLPESFGGNPSAVRATGSLGPFDIATTPSIDAGSIDINPIAR